MNLNGRRRASRNYGSLVYSIEETRVINLNEENLSELSFEAPDQVIHYILKELRSIDLKFNFIIRNLSSIDSTNVNIKQFYYFLLWKDLSKPNVCRLVNDDGFFASVELLKIPKSWSKYDIDKHVQTIGHKRILNGLSLRDDFIKGLIYILNMNGAMKANKDIIFKEIEFDHSTVRLIFSANVKQTDLFNESSLNRSSVISLDDSTVTLNESARATSSRLRNHTGSMASLAESTATTESSNTPVETTKPVKPRFVTYILNLTPIISFSNATPILLNQMMSKLCHHQIFANYFNEHCEMKFYLLSFNSFKWAYDVVYMEHLLFEFLLEQKKSPFCIAYKKLILIRKCWRKYFLKFLKIIENLKLHENNRRIQTSSVTRLERKVSIDSNDASTNNIKLFNDAAMHGHENGHHTSLSNLFEAAIERSLPEYLFRVLYLKECAKNIQLPVDNKEAFNSIVVTNVLDEIRLSLESKICESFLIKNKNIISKYCLGLDNCINIGLIKLFNEIILDWRRGRFGR